MQNSLFCVRSVEENHQSELSTKELNTRHRRLGVEKQSFYKVVFRDWNGGGDGGGGEVGILTFVAESKTGDIRKSYIWSGLGLVGISTFLFLYLKLVKSQIPIG